MTSCVERPGWRALMAQLVSYTEATFLRPFAVEPAMEKLLVPPVTLALWIQSFLPDLAERDSIHVLIAGVEKVDGIHHGIWYQLVPLLLGRPRLKIRVTLLYADASSRKAAPRAVADIAKAGAHLARATELSSTLGNYLSSATNDQPNLVMLFQPGFEKAVDDDVLTGASYGWLSPGELSLALEMEIPVGASAYDQIEFEQERWLLSAYGVKAADLTVQNPFVMEPSPFELSGPPMGWGSFLWRIDPASKFTTPASDHPVFLANLKATENLLTRLGTERPLDLWNLGHQVLLPVGESRELASVIVLADGFAVTRTHGKVMVVGEGGRLLRVRTAINLSPEILSRYPEQPEFLYERVIWGSDAFTDVMEQIEHIGDGFSDHRGVEHAARDRTRRPGDGRIPDCRRGGLVRSDRISEFLSGIAVAIKLPILSLAAWRSMLHPASDRRGSNEAGFGYTSSGSCRLSGGHGLPSHRL